MNRVREHKNFNNPIAMQNMRSDNNTIEKQSIFVASFWKVFVFALLIISICSSCTKNFDEINKNPFNPTETDIGPLFNSVISTLKLDWNEQFYLHLETMYGVTQLAAKTELGFDNISIGAEGAWINYNTGLVHIRVLEKRFKEMENEIEPEALNNVRAQLIVLLAYKTFHLTDMFGDIPFFDAGRGFESIDYARPKFDSQEEIYKYLLEELKWVEENINVFPNPETPEGTAYISFGTFDNLFDGDMMLWRKFANSLRLRHAIRMVEIDPDYASPIIKEILENELPLIEEGEDVGMYPAIQHWNNTGVNSVFDEHKKIRMGTTIWSMLSDNDNIDGSGIFDPRAYIFFETNNANEWVPFPQFPDSETPTEGGIPYGKHRDQNYSIKGADNLYSPFNYYLIRDELDIPEIILTAAEVGYLKAEAYIRGLGVPMDIGRGEEEFYVALVTSLKFWQGIFVNSGIWGNAPPVLSEGELFGVANHPRLFIFNIEEKLELIYAQRWLDNFRQPWEAFSLWRRTGMTPREGEAPEYYRFSYPPTEVENNPDNWSDQVSKMGEDSPEVKVWWMN